jgi:hypothetical protein
VAEEIEKKERLLSKRKPKQLFFAEWDSIPTESRFHPVSYFAPHYPEITDNEEELRQYRVVKLSLHHSNSKNGGIPLHAVGRHY